MIGSNAEAETQRVKWWLWAPAGMAVAFVGYGLTIPDYQIDARMARNICEKLTVTGNVSQWECDKNYSDAIEQGQAAGRAAMKNQPLLLTAP